MLNRYLNSRGINPQFVSKDTKISHAKSAEFAKWKNDHQFDDPKDTLNTVMADNLRRQKQDKLKEAVDEAMIGEEQKILKDLGSNAKDPSSKAYPNYVARINQARQRVMADIMSGGTSMLETPTSPAKSSGIKFLGWE